MKPVVVSGVAVGAIAVTLVVVPLLLLGGNQVGTAACAGSGAIEGETVPAGIELVARQAARQTGVDELALLALTYRETRWGQSARDELAVFWYWRQRLDEAPDAAPEEAVRWHHSLRASAHVWAQAYGGCRHESLGEVDEQRDGRAAKLTAMRPYLVTETGDVR